MRVRVWRFSCLGHAIVPGAGPESPGRPGLTPRWQQPVDRRRKLNSKPFSVGGDTDWSQLDGSPVLPRKLEAVPNAYPEPGLE
jgi:hypothetical protein